MLPPADFGSFYRETNMSGFPVEPWNTYSNLCFLLVVVYWFAKASEDVQRNKIVFAAGLVVLAGFVGGFCYHLWRASNLWRLVDVGAIGVLFLVVLIYSWLDIKKRAASLIAPLCACFGVLIVFSLLEPLIPALHGDLMYSRYGRLLAILLLPLIFQSYFHEWHLLPSLLKSLAFLFIASFFRYADLNLAVNWLPMGTHFLWHIFGAASTFFFFQFLYLSCREEAKAPHREEVADELGTATAP